MSLRRIFPLAALLTTAALPSMTFADSTGSPGYVISLTVHESSSDLYGTYRGSVTIRQGQEPGSTQTEYRWGGTLCSGRNVTEANIELLTIALRGRSDTQIVPRYKMGQGGVRCLVSFTLQEPVLAAR
ncbi:MAG: hypothetical protein R3B09_14780 [Nannocystaceae bacterium]